MDTLDLILLAAGDGRRVGSAEPKQFLEVAGRPLFIYSLAVYHRVPAIGRKIIVTRSDRIALRSVFTIWSCPSSSLNF